MFEYEEIIYIEGLEKVPRNQRLQFIFSQRTQSATEILKSLAIITDAFPMEIKKLSDPDDLKAEFEDFINCSTKFSTGVFEYLMHTFDTKPDLSLDFGLPEFLFRENTKHKGWFEIECDFDSYLGTKVFLVCLQKDSDDFGKVKLFGDKLYRVSDNFEEFLALFARFIGEEYYLNERPEEKAEAVADFFNDFIN
jgi:hypothetical protein